MKSFLLVIACCWLALPVKAQGVPQKLNLAVKEFLADPSMKYAIFGFYVLDGQTGKLVYERNANLGLAPASTQKLFTSAAAFELMGQGYRYKTVVGHNGKIAAGVLKGDLYLTGYGDPTLGSWRWQDTKPEAVLASVVKLLKEKQVNRIDGKILLNDTAFSIQPIPGGWIWDDIGNYYGAGSWGINWRENQYDLQLKPGNAVGAPTEVVGTRPAMLEAGLLNHITTGKKGSGDNGYIYRAPYGTTGFTQGTVPLGGTFTIAGSLPDPPSQLARELEEALNKQQISTSGDSRTSIQQAAKKENGPGQLQELGLLLSPPLDSINYWFLRRSINLYGEALVKTLAFEKEGLGTTEKGVELVRTFWQAQGIDKAAIHITDGSGLSPQNRVTAKSLVQVLQYAKGRPWYSSFYHCLPEYNGMKMKSGSINGARAFAGYHKAKNGKEFVYAIIVNNYDGSAGDAVRKMYRVLDVLK